MRNAVQRRNHKERAQPLERQKWGLLEKHKVRFSFFAFKQLDLSFKNPHSNILQETETSFQNSYSKYSTEAKENSSNKKKNNRTTPFVQKTTMKRNAVSKSCAKRPPSATRMNSPSA
jgi:hypothetical protein